MRLSELNTGDVATIVKVMGHGGFRRRIMEMGFVRGQRVEVILNAPLKDPIEYRIMGYEISLRRSEADMVEVLTDGEANEILSHRLQTRRSGPEAAAAAQDSAPVAAVADAADVSECESIADVVPWSGIPTAARPRCSTPFREATSMWATTAA